jgi:hypothetical protein
MNPINNSSLDFSQSKNKTIRDQLEESIKLEMSKLQQRKTESPSLSPPPQLAQPHAEPLN